MERPSKEHREAVEKVYEGAEHKGRALARWAKDGKGFKGRAQRWETVEWFMHVHQMATKVDNSHHAQDLQRRARFWRMYRWARAKRRGIRRRHREKPEKPTNTQAWGGSQAAGEKCATQIAAQYGLYISSRKRAANDPLSLSNPGSDHNEANKDAYAWDIATFNGEGPARAVARCLGIGNWSPGNYNGYTVNRPWGTYRAQILWAVSGHFNHVHVGMNRV